MSILLNAGLVLLTILMMELLSWLMHKYLFHGPLWLIHKTHHQERRGWFELNDVFSIGFAAFALWLMWLGHYKWMTGCG